MSRFAVFALLVAVMHLTDGRIGTDLASAQPQAEKDASIRRDLEKLQGVWYHASREQKGKEVAGEAKEILIAFRENVVVLKKGMEVSQVCVLKKIDATTNPKSFDLVITDGPNEGMTI